MIGKKINQLATELAPVSTDLTIIGDPTTGVSKKITLAQLGAIFSGAVSFYTNLAGFPAVGDINVIYCAKDTQKLYLWSGSAYVEVFPSQALLDTYQLRSEKGNANGYASLDSQGKVPISQLPSSIMEYKGTWNASTNTPTLANGTGDTGDVYICNVAGTVNFGAGPLTFAVGDYVIYSGTIWQRSSGAVGTVTSVAVSRSGDALAITGSPVTTSGTINIGFAGTSAEYINGAGNRITFPTLLSSVGLSMPSAFNVANSPLTANGTIAVTGAGNATQYVRGDGQLATLPTNGGGGGASVSYYLNGSINQGTIGGVTYYEMNKTPIIGAGTDFSRSSNGYIASFLTDANDPALLNIPAGNFNFETYFEASSGGGSPTFYIELYKYDGTNFTLIASNSGSPKLINDGTNIEAYFSALAVPETTLTLTDRLAIRIYVTTAGRTITLHTENGHLCQVITTFTTGLTALNGLTAQVQYFATGTSGSDFNISSATATHTFNLPTASATNRGALASADWTTFNNKQNALNGTGFVKISGTTISYDNSTYYLASNPNAYIALTALSAGAGISYNNTTGVIASTITQYTDANARAAISLTTSGTSGAATYNSTTGVLNVPQYAPDLSGYVPTSRTLTINGTAYDLSANRSWSVGTVTSVGLSSATSGVTIGSTPITTSGTITLAIATASGSQQGLLSSTDWTTFNNKQNALTNPVTGTGTTNYLPKFTGASTIGNSIMSESGTAISVAGNMQVRGDWSSTFPVYQLTDTRVGGVEWNIENGREGVGNLSFYRGGTKMLLTTSGNLGLGVTPSAWGSTVRALQFENGGSIASNQSTQVSFNNNVYSVPGTNDYYISSAFATRYIQFQGQHIWSTAPSGTAGNAISFTQAMTLNASGNLSLGNTNDTYKLDVTGTGRFTGDLNILKSSGAYATITTDATTGVNFIFKQGGVVKHEIFTNTTQFAIYNSTTGAVALGIANATGAATFSSSVTAGGVTVSGGNTLQLSGGTGNNWQLYKDINNGLQFYLSGGGPAMYINSSQNVGIGTTTPAGILTVIGPNSAGISIDQGNYNYYGAYQHVFMSSGYASEYMRITNTGNVGIGTTSPAAILHTQQTSAGNEVTGLLIQNVGNSASTAVSLNFAPHENASSPTTLAKISAVRTAIDNAPTNLVFHTFNNTLQERMRITSGGDLYVKGNGSDITLSTRIYSDDTYSDFLASATSATAKTMRFFAKNTLETMRITSGGSVLIGTTTEGFLGKLQVAGSVAITGQYNTVLPSSSFSYFDGSGQVVSSSSSASALYLDTTWNTTGNPDGIYLNVTNTASGASSKLLNLKVGSVSQFSVSKAGAIQTTAPSSGSAQPWKLGSYAAGGTGTATGVIYIEINGQIYSIPALQGTP